MLYTYQKYDVIYIVILYYDVIYIVTHMGYFKNKFEPFEIWKGRVNIHVHLNF